MASYSRTALFLLFFLCRSEAFASQQSGGGIPSIVRGGETSHKRATSTTAFVMKQPPPLFAAPAEEDPSRKKNGVLRSTPVEFVAETKLPTDIGQFQLRAYRTRDSNSVLEPCVIYSRSKPPTAKSVAVRIHDQCITSEVFRSQR